MSSESIASNTISFFVVCYFLLLFICSPTALSAQNLFLSPDSLSVNASIYADQPVNFSVVNQTSNSVAIDSLIRFQGGYGSIPILGVVIDDSLHTLIKDDPKDFDDLWDSCSKSRENLSSSFAFPTLTIPPEDSLTFSIMGYHFCAVPKSQVFDEEQFAFFHSQSSDSLALQVFFEIPVSTEESPIVSTFSLDQNYPNPFNPETTISFALKTASVVRIDIYNISGRLIDTLVNQPFSQGRHSVSWNASNYSSGFYLYRITTDQGSQTRKMLLLK